jgi:hypothetical protein
MSKILGDVHQKYQLASGAMVLSVMRNRSDSYRDVYDVGLGFICRIVKTCLAHDKFSARHTFLLPPVIVTLTKRRVYVILFFARPLGVFFFS